MTTHNDTTTAPTETLTPAQRDAFLAAVSEWLVIPDAHDNTTATLHRAWERAGLVGHRSGPDSYGSGEGLDITPAGYAYAESLGFVRYAK